MNEKELYHLIAECKKNDSHAQRKLFSYMYNYGMTVASRYGSTLAESEDIANEGFYKVLKNIGKYDPKIPFLAWVRRIIINCGIDHFRKQRSKKMASVKPLSTISNNGLKALESEYLLQMVRSLPPQYKMVFVLHAIEGFSHEEIASKLKINKGTSKSNLAKARKKLQEMVTQHNKIYDHVRKG